MRLALDTGVVWWWDGSAWDEIDADAVLTASDTNSIDLTYAAHVLSADLKLSASAAPAGFFKATASIQSDGLRVVAEEATGSQTGFLTSANWTSFNSRVLRSGDTMTGELKADGGIDVTVTGGTDTLNIGVTNAEIINIGNAGATVNVQGTTFYQDVTNLNVTDKNILVNDGGSAGSATLAGLDIEEGGSVTGYARTSADRNSWEIKAPNTAGVATVTPGASGITLNQSSHDPVTIGTANGLSLAGQALSLGLSSTSTTGALSDTDWDTFNNKEPAIAAATAADYWRGDKTFQQLNMAALTAATDGGAATAGDIGELLTATQATNTTAGVAATGTWGDVVSISLAAGVWEIYGTVGVNENTAVLTASISCGVSDSATGVGLSDFDITEHGYLISGTANSIFSSPPIVVSIAATTTYYLNTRFYYTSGTPRHRGRIKARRIR
jgi:hypothetical protein